MHALRGIQRPTTWNVSNQPKNGFDRCVIIYTSSASAELDGVPKTSVDFLGERRHMSPNDACVILCDHVAERERQKPISDGYTLCVGSMILAIGYVHLKQFEEHLKTIWCVIAAKSRYGIDRDDDESKLA